MDNRYGGFQWRYNGDAAAANYFDSLPLEVKEELNRRGGDIHSLNDLETLATYLEGKLES